ncbi:hypothetical protein HM1_0502 [Heliomicrobium modesticaldum Ice1]|uniref:Uncharacterized protein n=1 Tax=Heliobacterium modesticaldum (strain ATCC 51547 / Ice1) TaxID=498761 RepID=B0TFL7_HELMI|nr:hypothetical protein [Heliomicrobium modesticaldum]ABZ83116.1 hypothetical protein HM1_0502 [Heliomicrobium modesticaldum Ice1]
MDSKDKCSQQAANTNAHQMEAANELTPNKQVDNCPACKEPEVETW